MSWVGLCPHKNTVPVHRFSSLPAAASDQWFVSAMAAAINAPAMIVAVGWFIVCQLAPSRPQPQGWVVNPSRPARHTRTRSKPSKNFRRLPSGEFALKVRAAPAIDAGEKALQMLPRLRQRSHRCRPRAHQIAHRFMSSVGYSASVRRRDAASPASKHHGDRS